jgi:hypothetical protein
VRDLPRGEQRIGDGPEIAIGGTTGHGGC